MHRVLDVECKRDLEASFISDRAVYASSPTHLESVCDEEPSSVFQVLTLHVSGSGSRDSMF